MLISHEFLFVRISRCPYIEINLRISMIRLLPYTNLLSRGYATQSYKSILKKRTKRGTTDETSRDNVFHLELKETLKSLPTPVTLEQVKVPEGLIYEYLFSRTSTNEVIENVTILAQTNEGEGIALLPRHYYAPSTDKSLYTVVKVPKTVVGDNVSVILRRHHDYFAEAELVAVARKSRKNSKRNDRLVICDHFDTCSGCQLQFLSYEDQLAFKKTTIEKAFLYFYPALPQGPQFGQTVGSPMQFAYRTKLTPHARIPKEIGASIAVGFDDVKPGRGLVDVKSCPIAVPSINAMLPKIKENLLKEAADLESTKKITTEFILRDSIRVNHATGEYSNVCLTDRKNVVTEKVDEFVFQFEANEFFQNNRYILPTFLEFIRHELSQIPGGYEYLVDSYCGSGLLGISLSNTLPDSGKVFGIEIAKKAIKYAKHNAEVNGLSIPSKIEFVEGNSDAMFTNEAFLKSGVMGADSVLLMNPSRKGSSKHFMKQLLEFRPKAIVYVSCNAFSQARDLADFEKFQELSETKYKVKSVTGFDFYPQTKHVESVAILELVQ